MLLHKGPGNALFSVYLWRAQSIKFEENYKHTLSAENPSFWSAIENIYMFKTKPTLWIIKEIYFMSVGENFWVYTSTLL